MSDPVQKELIAILSGFCRDFQALSEAAAAHSRQTHAETASCSASAPAYGGAEWVSLAHQVKALQATAERLDDTLQDLRGIAGKIVGQPTPVSALIHPDLDGTIGGDLCYLNSRLMDSALALAGVTYDLSARVDGGQ